MLSRMKDTNVFFIANILNVTCNTLFYFMPNGIAQYVCLALTVMGVSAEFNTMYVLLEMRVPP